MITFWALAGMVACAFGVVLLFLLHEWTYFRRSERWCRRNGLELRRIESSDGRSYGYVGYDPEKGRWYAIPEDYGEKDDARSIGSRVNEDLADWKGTDKVAVEKDGTVTRLEFNERR